MEISSELYRNLMNAGILITEYNEKESKIILSEQDSTKLELGLISAVIKQVYTGSVPEASEFNQVNTSTARLYNWNLLIKPLEAIGIPVSSDTKALIVAGDRMQVVEILETVSRYVEKCKRKKKVVKTTDGALLLSNIDSENNLDDSDSILEFLILSFCKAFQISAKVSAGLLTQKCAFLAQIMNKGLKASYDPILGWLEMVNSHSKSVVKLIENDNKSLHLILSCLRPGLNSKNAAVSKRSAEVLSFYHIQFKYFEPSCWSWLSSQPENLQSMIKSIEDHSEDPSAFISVLFSFSKKNLGFAFNSYLRDYYNDNKKYLGFIQACFVVISKPPYSQHFFNQGLIEIWADIGLREAENSSRVLDDRAFFIVFLCELWLCFPLYIEARENLGAGMLVVITRSTRENLKAYKLLIYGKLFELFSAFTLQKCSSAPIMYKSLTFFLIENFSNEIIREFLLRNFMRIFNELSLIPLVIFLEPYIKQSQLSKNFTYNTFDIDFHRNLCTRPKINTKEAILILDLLGKIIVNEWYFSRVSIDSFLILLERFTDSNPISEFTIKYLSVALKISFLDSSKTGQKHEKIIKNNIIFLIQQILRLENYDIIFSLKEIVEREEYRRLKDPQLEVLYRILGISSNYTSGKIDKGSQEDEKKLINIYVVPKGRVMEDLEKVKKKRLEKEEKEKLEVERRQASENLQKKALKKQIEKRRIELGVKSKGEDDLLMITDATENESMFLLNRICEESAEDQIFIDIISKKYLRVVKAIFNRFAGSTNKKLILPITTFENMQLSKENFSESDYFKLLRDSNISSFFISVEDIKYVFSVFCSKIKLPTVHYENFLDILYMTACWIYMRHGSYAKYPSALAFQSLFEALKNSDLPSQIFDDLSPGKGDREIVKILNENVESNPDMLLPQNYTKYKESALVVSYSAQCGNDSFKICIEILDDIFYKAIHTHFLLPIISIEVKTRVKGTRLLDEAKPKISRIESAPGFASLSSQTKLSALTIQSVPHESIVECGKLLDDILYSVSKNSPSLISKHARPAGTINNQVIQLKKNKEVEKIIEIEKLEQKRKNRAAAVEEEINRFREQKAIKEKLEEEEKNKSFIKAMFLEKRLKDRNEKKREETTEKINEYRLAKAKLEKKQEKSMWRMGKPDRKVNVSTDLRIRPNSINVSPSERERNKNMSVSNRTIIKKP